MLAGVELALIDDDLVVDTCVARQTVAFEVGGILPAGDVVFTQRLKVASLSSSQRLWLVDHLCSSSYVQHEKKKEKVCESSIKTFVQIYDIL